MRWRDLDLLQASPPPSLFALGAAAKGTRMSKDTYTAMSEDGLRYESKLGGSPFLGSGHTRSCFKCGRHRPPSALQSKRVLGRNEVVCKPSCPPSTKVGNKSSV